MNINNNLNNYTAYNMYNLNKKTEKEKTNNNTDAEDSKSTNNNSQVNNQLDIEAINKKNAENMKIVESSLDNYYYSSDDNNEKLKAKKEEEPFNDETEKLKRMIRMMKAIFGENKSLDKLEEFLDDQNKKTKEHLENKPKYNEDGIPYYDPANPTPGIHDSGNGTLGITFPKDNSWKKIVDIPEEILNRMEKAVKSDFIKNAKGMYNTPDTSTDILKNYVFSLAKKGDPNCFSAHFTLSRYVSGYIDALYDELHKQIPNFTYGNFDETILDKFDGTFGMFYGL